MTDRITQLAALLETDPQDPFCLYGLAFEYAKIGEDDKAIDYFDQTIAIDADYFYAYYHKAVVQKKQGNSQAARVTASAGLQRARAAGDGHTVEELEALLDELR